MPQSNDWQDLIDQASKAFEQRRLAKAEEFFVAAMQMAETFADDDARKAISLNNLAALYHSQGKYAFAEERYKRALELNKKIFGEESMEVARNLYNLAVLCSAKARYGEAEELYGRSLAIKEKLFGGDHRDLVAHLESYAELLRRAGKVQEAESISLRAAGIVTNK